MARHMSACHRLNKRRRMTSPSTWPTPKETAWLLVWLDIYCLLRCSEDKYGKRVCSTDQNIHEVLLGNVGAVSGRKQLRGAVIAAEKRRTAGRWAHTGQSETKPIDRALAAETERQKVSPLQGC